jgi:hypothetical protein
MMRLLSKSEGTKVFSRVWSVSMTSVELLYVERFSSAHRGLCVGIFKCSCKWGEQEHVRGLGIVNWAGRRWIPANNALPVLAQ